MYACIAVPAIAGICLSFACVGGLVAITLQGTDADCHDSDINRWGMFACLATTISLFALTLALCLAHCPIASIVVFATHLATNFASFFIGAILAPSCSGVTFGLAVTAASLGSLAVVTMIVLLVIRITMNM